MQQQELRLRAAVAAAMTIVRRVNISLMLRAGWGLAIKKDDVFREI